MVCAYTRPRYRVSVYRTIGPLVLILYHFPQSAYVYFYCLAGEQERCSWYLKAISASFGKHQDF